MSNFEIAIGEDLSYPQTVFTEVCLKMEDICFPGDVWSDFTYSTKEKNANSNIVTVTLRSVCLNPKNLMF